MLELQIGSIAAVSLAAGLIGLLFELCEVVAIAAQVEGADSGGAETVVIGRADFVALRYVVVGHWLVVVVLVEMPVAAAAAAEWDFVSLTELCRVQFVVYS